MVRHVWQGLKNLTESLKIFLYRQIRDSWGEVQLSTYLGDLEIDQGHLREAEMMYGKARTLSKTLGDRAKEVMALHGLGILNANPANMLHPRSY